MATFTTQYRIRYIVLTTNGNKEIRSIICDNRYEVQINIKKIITMKNKGYSFIGLDDRIISSYNLIDDNYGWNKIFNF